MGKQDHFRRQAAHRPTLEFLESRRVLAAAPLVISEFMATNLETLRDRYRIYSDWIEIHNPTDVTVNLEDWSLTDDADNLALWQFPDIELAGGEYLVVFASGRDRDSRRELHTNFRLRSEGEYLALVDPEQNLVHEYAEPFPEQQTDISYGLMFEDSRPVVGRHQFFSTPTPGQANADGADGFAAPVAFSVSRGFFEEPFALTLSTNTLGGTIRYTTDGSEPTRESMVFRQPVLISETTTLRAAAFGDDLLRGQVGTQTYLFLDDVLQQTGEGMPEEWGYFDDLGPRRPARAEANYEMDPDIVNDPQYADTIKDDLRSLPTVSIVLDPERLFDFENGIYSNPEQRGDQWTPRMSMEWIDRNGESMFQANAGIRIHGGWARRFSQNRKLSFRAVFQGKFGEPTLDYPIFGPDAQQEFTGIVLRGGFNDQWRNGNSSSTYVQDQWTRQAQLDMGGFAPRHNYVHLYLNGLYWGVYSPTERPDALWAASYMGGEPDDYDVINTGGNVVDGERDAYTNLMRSLSPRRFDYETVAAMVDLESFADYLIVNQFVVNWDWPHNNWYATRRRVDGAKWQFHTWDAEAAFQRPGEDRVVTDIRDQEGPGRLYLRLRDVPQFQEIYQRRIQKHLFNGGELTVERSVERLQSIYSQIDRAIVGESARWGDGWNDRGRALTRERNWLRRLTVIEERTIPRLHQTLIRVYRDAGLFPPVDAPTFAPTGGRLTPGESVQLAVPSGDIYYTLDGTDPVDATGQPGSQANRLNALDLVAPGDSVKLRVPTGEDSEADWQTVAYDDADWTSATGALGYDTGVSEDPISVPDGFDVKAYLSSERLNGWDVVEAVLAGENRDDEMELNVPIVNFFQGGRDANFESNNYVYPFGERDDRIDNVVVDVTGTMVVRQAGTYSLGVSSNDAARLFIDGEEIYADEDRHLTEDRYVTVQLTEGAHQVHLTGFERTGTAVLEFFFAQGEKTEFDDDFLLVGDTKHRPFDDLIVSDISSMLEDRNASSVYVRVPFTFGQEDTFDRLQLRSRHDAGVIVYLNGTEVHRQLAPEDANFNAVSTGSVFDTDALAQNIVDLTEHRDLLQVGNNVLAFHVLNESEDDSDMLLTTQLTGVVDAPTIKLDRSAVVTARTKVDDEWSAMAVAKFTVAELATASSLRISEIHYHPTDPTADEVEAGFDDGDDFEFIELTNVSNQTIDLSETRLIRSGPDNDGVAFDFATAPLRELAPGGHLVVVEDLEAFEMRYGADRPVAGEWTGGLGNGGELVTLVTGQQSQQLTYDDQWHPTTDGSGPSLERIDPQVADMTHAQAWRPSRLTGGTPGTGPGGRPGDTNRDGVFDATDLLLALQSGEFEDNIQGNSDWEEGDWNGDGEFDTKDLVFAFRESVYQGPADAF